MDFFGELRLELANNGDILCRDGKDDYAYIDDNSALWLWWNRGTTDSTTALGGIRFADINGDGVSVQTNWTHSDICLHLES